MVTFIRKNKIVVFLVLVIMAGSIVFVVKTFAQYTEIVMATCIASDGTTIISPACEWPKYNIECSNNPPYTCDSPVGAKRYKACPNDPKPTFEEGVCSGGTIKTKYPPEAPTCTEDTWTCSNWNVCSTEGSQIRTCSLTVDCPSASTPSPSTSQSCTPPAPKVSCQKKPRQDLGVSDLQILSTDTEIVKVSFIWHCYAEQVITEQCPAKQFSRNATASNPCKVGIESIECLEKSEESYRKGNSLFCGTLKKKSVTQPAGEPKESPVPPPPPIVEETIPEGKAECTLADGRKIFSKICPGAQAIQCRTGETPVASSLIEGYQTCRKADGTSLEAVTPSTVIQIIQQAPPAPSATFSTEAQESTPQSCQQYKTEAQESLDLYTVQIKFYEKVPSRIGLGNSNLEKSFEKKLKEASPVLRRARKLFKNFQCDAEFKSKFEQEQNSLQTQIEGLKKTLFSLDEQIEERVKFTGIQETFQNIAKKLDGELCKKPEKKTACEEISTQFQELKRNFREVAEDQEAVLAIEIRDLNGQAHAIEKRLEKEVFGVAKIKTAAKKSKVSKEKKLKKFKKTVKEKKGNKKKKSPKKK